LILRALPDPNAKMPFDPARRILTCSQIIGQKAPGSKSFPAIPVNYLIFPSMPLGLVGYKTARNIQKRPFAVSVTIDRSADKMTILLQMS
jgi:hypothetical protein